MPFKDPEVRRAKGREYTRRDYQKHLERRRNEAKGYARAKRKNAREQVNTAQAEWRRQNPEREKLHQRKKHLKLNFGSYILDSLGDLS